LKEQFLPFFGIAGFWPWRKYTFTDNSLLYGKNEYPYAQLSPITLTTQATRVVNGIAETTTSDGKTIVLSYDYKDRERFPSTMAIVNELISFAHGYERDYKFIFLSPNGSKLEVYEDYLILHYLSTEAGGVIGMAGDKISTVGGNLGKGLSKVLKGVGSVSTAIGNVAKGGALIKVIVFEDLNSFEVDVDTLKINEISIPISPQDMELVNQIKEFIYNAQSLIKSSMCNYRIEHDEWGVVRGTERRFSLLGRELEIPVNMDSYNTYRKRFVELALKYTAQFELEYNKKVRDLITFMEFHPRIYRANLIPLVQEAVDVLIREGIWTVTPQMFLENQMDNFDLAFEDMLVMLESITLTAEENIKSLKNITSLVPNLSAFGFGLKSAAKSIAVATAFNLVRDGLEDMALQNAANLQPSQQYELYNRINPEVLFSNVFADYGNVFMTLVDLLTHYKRDVFVFDDDVLKDAHSIFINLQNPVFPQEKEKEILVRIMRSSPYIEEYYDYIESKHRNTEEINAIKSYFSPSYAYEIQTKPPARPVQSIVQIPLKSEQSIPQPVQQTQSISPEQLPQIKHTPQQSTQQPTQQSTQQQQQTTQIHTKILCVKCGNELRVKSKFCSKCGTRK
jgi:hypothetical protein